MRRTGAAAGITLLAACVALAAGQDARPGSAPADPPKASARASVAFAFLRPGLEVPRYKVTVYEDGTGTYEGEQVMVASQYGPAATASTQAFRREVTVSPATAERIFRLARSVDGFHLTCESKAKNVANSGAKTLSYSGADGSGSCTYNYSENKDVEALTETFQGIALTLEEGRELDRLHRYDRLGLDAAISYLADQVSAGHALEIGNIEATLRSIVDDADVIQRVRSRADKLLLLVPGATPVPAP